MPSGLPVGAVLRVASHMTGILFSGGRGDGRGRLRPAGSFELGPFDLGQFDLGQKNLTDFFDLGNCIVHVCRRCRPKAGDATHARLMSTFGVSAAPAMFGCKAG